MTISNGFLSSAAAVCPQNLLKLAAKSPPPKVAIARAGAALPMQAAKEATQAGIMNPIFVGEQDRIQAVAQNLDWDISGFSLIHAEGEAASANAAALACSEGHADVLMKGDLHTDQFMKAVLTRANGLRTENRLVHIFYISSPDESKTLMVSDAAVNVSPDLETRKAATVACKEILKKTGVARPKIAFLSATESEIPSVPSSLEAGELRTWASETMTDADFSGPLALDLILSPESAAVKGLGDDKVAGQADAVIVPDIVSGNTLFKSLVYLSGGCAAGIVMGAKVPVLLTSRADPAAARLASAALASIVAS